MTCQGKLWKLGIKDSVGVNSAELSENRTSAATGFGVALQHFHDFVVDNAVGSVGEVALSDGFILNRQILT